LKIKTFSLHHDPGRRIKKCTKTLGKCILQDKRYGERYGDYVVCSHLFSAALCGGCGYAHHRPPPAPAQCGDHDITAMAHEDRATAERPKAITAQI
jgi:hypothetical protein